MSARVAQTVSLLVHELATNAVKHGALGAETGRISVSWSLGGGQLRLDWRETGGPPARAPARIGFGSRLIHRGLTGNGGVEPHYGPEGLALSFVASVDSLQEP